MTLKQRKFAKALVSPNVKTLKEAGAIAGYSFGARNIYRQNTHKHIIKLLASLGIDKNSMNDRFKLLADMAMKDKDYANTNRSYENICKIQRFFETNSQSDIGITQFTINFVNNKPTEQGGQPIIEVKQTNK